ncbi:AAA family ATPase [Propioniciclava soli]|uniref:Cytidylate kinase-like family protein n=1 Tax=Propioniciclava soli TaxID=2775081 RepID=A0ABZ3C8Z5_9ACTN|nr:cytidylate kinase-like family protein [Propioniciclava soli]
MASEQMPPVVTLHEEYGCGAREIGERVAASLGVEYVGRAMKSETIDEIAGDADEGGFVERFLRSFTPIPSHDANIAWALEAHADHEVADQNNRYLADLAQDGAVIHGRAGAHVLADRPATLHVKLIAPLSTRITRAATEAGITPERARHRQAREDRVRTDFCRRLYRWDPRENDRFDLVVNTASFTPEQAADLIVTTYRLHFPV